MEPFERYLLWRDDPAFDADTRAELAALDPAADRAEILDRFSAELAFGTGGLRAVMAAGTNRMNRYTVGRATRGVGLWLLDRFGARACRERGAVICYDTRVGSRDFARTAADVLSAMGVKALLFDAPRPTPQLSFAVRRLHCLAGVVITASHNTREYNGYKVYDEEGCQLVPALAERVRAWMDAAGDYRSIGFAADPSLIQHVDVTADFVRAAMARRMEVDAAAKADLRVVYTPLHGAGRVPVCMALAEDGFVSLETVRAQCDEDGSFPTVPTPNPEDPAAMEMAVAQAEASGADIVLGTDPDCDRVGVAVRRAGAYVRLSGNQIAALLVDYLLRDGRAAAYRRPAVVTTIVSSDLGARVASLYGARVFTTLTGFKYIGEKAVQFAAARAAGDVERAFDFVIGYEESCGYLAGEHARDKDAVSTALLLCEMAAEYKRRGETLADRLEQLYARTQFTLDALDSVPVEGADWQARTGAAMRALRSGPAYPGAVRVVDYARPQEDDGLFGPAPLSDVIKFCLDDGSWVAIRPSGTEPRIKAYYCIAARDRAGAEERLRQLRAVTAALLAR